VFYAKGETIMKEGQTTKRISIREGKIKYIIWVSVKVHSSSDTP
jgi:hypothetical protein